MSNEPVSQDQNKEVEIPKQLKYFITYDQLTAVNFIGIALVFLASSDIAFQLTLVKEITKEDKENEFGFCHIDGEETYLISYIKEQLLADLDDEKFRELQANLVAQLTVIIKDSSIKTTTINALTNIVNVARLTEHKCKEISLSDINEEAKATLITEEVSNVISFYFHYFDTCLATVLDETYAQQQLQQQQQQSTTTTN